MVPPSNHAQGLLNAIVMRMATVASHIVLADIGDGRGRVLLFNLQRRSKGILRFHCDTRGFAGDAYSGHVAQDHGTIPSTPEFCWTKTSFARMSRPASR